MTLLIKPKNVGTSNKNSRNPVYLGARLALLYKNMQILAIGSVLVAFAVCGILYTKVSAPLLFGWLATVIVINTIRFKLSCDFHRIPLRERERKRWHQRAFFISLANGVCWGGLAIVVFQVCDFMCLGLLAAIYLGMSVVAAVMTAHFLSVYLAFMLPALLPVAIGLLLSSENTASMSAFVIMGSAIFVLPFIAWKIQRIVVDTLGIAEHNRELLSSPEAQTMGHIEVQNHLSRLNEQHRQLLQSTNEGILGVNLDGRCTIINAAGLEILGFTEEEFLFSDVHKLIHHTYSDGGPYQLQNCPIYRAYQDGKNSHVTTDIMFRKNGSSFPVEYSASPLVEDSEIRGAVVMFRDVTDSRAMIRRLEFLAKHDTLTGLYNRKSFQNKMEELISGSDIEESQHVLCYLDIDQFKIINDTCGHEAGDLLLQQLSREMHNNIRHSDYLARLGGDEFGLLLQNCTLMQAIRIIEKLLDMVRDYRFQWQEATFKISLSIGVVEINNKTESSVDALSQADSACFMAKEGGRDRVHIYRVDDSAILRRHGEMEWVAIIQEALENDRFFLMQQPIVGTQCGKSEHRHFEVLVRMRDQEGNVIPPNDFIPSAERYNLMPGLDRWVIKAVFKWMYDHPDEVEKLAFCAINLSGQSISDEQMLEYIVENMANYTIPPNKVCFEITETAAIANFDRAKELIEDLKMHGCQFALDDFGSGMSSFSYLKNLSIDYLKIDGGFVKDMLTDPHNRAIVEAINQVGHVMGKKTIAEFVENQEIRSALEEIGVDYVQGYGISPPVPLMPQELHPVAEISVAQE